MDQYSYESCLAFRVDRFSDDDELCGSCGWLFEEHVLLTEAFTVSSELQSRQAS